MTDKTVTTGYWSVSLCARSNPCRVYWGSHGCQHERGHDGPHECDCCTCLDHAASNEPEPGCVCVAKPPYYGPDTRFYGEDVPA